VSALQMLTWLDGRNNSSFGSLAWSGNTLSFKITQATGARNLQAMLPMNRSTGTLSSISLSGSAVTFALTVVTFSGVDTSGTNGSGAVGATGVGNAASGGPTASLITTRNNSWVIGMGNDWDKAIARTLGANQSLIHQFLSSVGDTYWVQMQNSPAPLSGTTVTINDTAPTTDQYNLSIVEVLPHP
jgi:hypothetical protein